MNEKPQYNRKSKITKKNVKLCIISFFLLFVINSLGQSITWQRLLVNNYGVLEKIQQTTYGGYIAVGSDRVNNQSKIYLVKLDNQGDNIWTKIIGNGENQGKWVEQTTDGGYIIGGKTDTNSFISYAYIIKTDSLGNIQWQKLFHNSDSDICNCVRQTSDGGFILSCVTWPGVGRMAWFIKTDSAGNLTWQKSYGDGTTSIVINELQILNNRYIASGFKGTGASADMILMKLNSGGDTLWNKTFGGSQTDAGLSIAVHNNSYIMAGNSASFNVNNKLEAYIVKTDSNGQLQWQRTYSHSGQEGSGSVRYKSGLGYIFAGYSDSLNNNIYRAKIRAIDFSGNLLFETSFKPGTQDAEFRSVELTFDGGLIVAGFEQSSISEKMYVVKTDSIGRANPIGILNQQDPIPGEYILSQNYPNPFNPVTNIKYEIPKDANVSIKIYDVLGKEVFSINEYKKPGSYEVQFDASSYSSGVYFYKFAAETSQRDVFTDTKKMILLK